MSPQAASIIDHWAREAIRHAQIQQLSDRHSYGEVPGCEGVIATGGTRAEVEQELFSVLEEWALLGMRLGDEIPVYGQADLNSENARKRLTCVAST
jgi:predicted RNase H-like HicB family nuclease